ncbi:Fe-S cluster assembly protein NifU [Halothiobacillus diazotrophicus]|uniref:Nitrogen fixation protein NifU n=1 Tax=Halothiobacillus diazotrophicus TaxID=1860122 RepID=A0A191ZED9_9GAMM|nr:Fe-S cluster assembly protein NifU [Halothiobacillus diazotrophicus]ANJ66234.1 Fe-S cluster assembly protein NifU [Halothiobacillus diazotrophicus]
MWDYTDKVKEYFFNPKNTGVLEEANAIGEVGSISCGDALRLMLQVDPETDVITDARFQTFGCGSAIASSSALTEIIKGKTLDEALAVTNMDIAEFLGGLPPEKMHCSVMGAEALHAAIANYRGEEWADDHEEGELICKCFGIDSAMIEKVAKENNLHTLQEVTFYTKAGGGCESCHEKIERVLAEVHGLEPVAAKPPAQTVTQTVTISAPVSIQPLKPKPAAPAAAAPATGGMTLVQKIQKISAVIDEMRPQFKMDGGDIQLVDVDGDTVSVAMSGACMGCQMSGITISGIQERLMLTLGRPIRVVPAPMPQAQSTETMGV